MESSLGVAAYQTPGIVRLQQAKRRKVHDAAGYGLRADGQVGRRFPSPSFYQRQDSFSDLAPSNSKINIATFLTSARKTIPIVSKRQSIMAARSKTAPAPKQGETPTRKRKAHKKSRLGCRNCKLRRVKCNESRPMCGQCLEFGVICNYDPTIPDLQPQTAASDVVQLPSQVERSPLSTTEPIIDMMNAYFQQDKLLSKTTSMPGLLRFDHSELAGLNRFQTRTVLTIAVKQVARVFHNQVTHLACQHRFLMHLVQAVTASHDRCESYLSIVYSPAED